MEKHIVIDLQHEYGEATYNAYSDERKAELRDEVLKRLRSEDIYE